MRDIRKNVFGGSSLPNLVAPRRSTGATSLLVIAPGFRYSLSSWPRWIVARCSTDVLICCSTYFTCDVCSLLVLQSQCTQHINGCVDLQWMGSISTKNSAFVLCEIITTLRTYYDIHVMIDVEMSAHFQYIVRGHYLII